MSTLPDSTIAADLMAAELAQAEWVLALNEFHVAVKFSDWDRAEACRLRVMGHCEAHLDAIMRAWKRTEIAQGRS